MINSKLTLLAIFFTILMAVSAVSATENATQDITTDSMTEELEIENSQTISSDDDGSFQALRDKIINAEENSTIILKNNYSYDDGFSKYGILIYKKLTIDGNGHTIDGASDARIFRITADNVVLKNITFINAKATGYSRDGYGAAIYHSASSINVSDCSFIDNYAKYGGAIYGYNCYLDNCIFKNNHADEDGGALYCENLAFVSSSDFTVNTAGDDGGAVYSKDCAYVEDSVFSNNSASDNGGGIGVKYSCFAVGSSFSSNRADTNGGVLYGDDCTVVLCNFTSNRAGEDGGALYGDVNCSVIGSVFRNNHADDDGGAVYGKLVSYASSSIFFNNSASDSGGAVGASSSCNAVNSTFLENYADTSGGALYGDVCSANKSNFTFNRAGEDGGALYGDIGCDVADSIFANNFAGDDGGAIYGKSYSVATNSTFSNNSAVDGGGAIVGGINCTVSDSIFNNNSADSGGCINCEYCNVTGSVFTDNNATNYGAAANSEKVSDFNGCLFIRNAARVGVIYNSNKGDFHSNINSNIFLNHHSDEIYFKKPENANFDYNWFGNNADNFNVSPLGWIGTWLFLNATSDHSDVQVLNSTALAFRLCSYNSTSQNISEYDNSLLKAIKFKITSVNGDVDHVEACLDECITYTSTCGGNGSVTASIEDVNMTIMFNNVRLDSMLAVQSQIIQYNADVFLTISYNASAGGLINITLKGKNHNYTVANVPLNTTVSLPVISADEYLVTVEYGGTDIFENATAKGNLTVMQKQTGIVALNSTVDLHINDTFKVNYKLDPSDAVGDVRFNSTNSSIIRVDEITGEVTALGEGVARVIINFTGSENYTSSIASVEFNVVGVIIEADDAKCGVGSSFTYSGKLVDKKGIPIPNGLLIFTVDGKSYNSTTNDAGLANITLLLGEGSYNITISNELAGNVTKNITVLSRIAESKDLVMDYLGSDYRFQVIGDDGNPVGAGEIVKMTVNGVTYDIKTDNDGYAVLPINLRPKTYDITSTYKGTTVKNTITVNPTLKAKKVFKVKKTAKKLVLKATLKSNGKAIASKKIIFKFKGKKYSAKTDRNGVAKVTIKKNIIKKLKKGKKYKLKVSFKNEDVYSKVLVKK